MEHDIPIDIKSGFLFQFFTHRLALIASESYWPGRSSTPYSFSIREKGGFLSEVQEGPERSMRPTFMAFLKISLPSGAENEMQSSESGRL